MIKNSKTTNSSYGNKAFPKVNVFFSHTPFKITCFTIIQSPRLPLGPKIFINKNSLMFYSNSNGDKNYVI